MFQKNNTMSNREVSGHDAETIIAASVKVEGDFASQGNVLIEGTVEGSLRTERNLRVGEKANISANVFAANASVAGEVKGNITVTERLELESTAHISGDIQTKSLIVANGAVIDGRVSMGQKEIKKEKEDVKSKIKADKSIKSLKIEDEAEEAEVEMEKDKKVAKALFER